MPILLALLLAAAPPAEWPSRRPRSEGAKRVVVYPVAMSPGLADAGAVDKLLLDALASDPDLRVVHPDRLKAFGKEVRDPEARMRKDFRDRLMRHLSAEAVVSPSARAEVGGTVEFEYRLAAASDQLPSGGAVGGSRLKMRSLVLRLAKELQHKLKARPR